MRASLNSKFVGIEVIKKAQIEARDSEIDVGDSDKTDKLNSTLSHITIS